MRGPPGPETANSIGPASPSRAIPKEAIPDHLLQVEPLGEVERQNVKELWRQWSVGQGLRGYSSPAERCP
jgi:hypothetical protein